MARSQLANDEGAEIIDAAELLNTDVYADLEPNALPDTPEAREHGLFLERLEQLMHEQEAAVRAFAEREGKPVDYIRRHVALAHSRFLFDKNLSDNGTPHTVQGPSLSARAVVAKVCHALDALHTAGHYESLVLVTSAKDGDRSFIGGTKIGKSFWDSLKMGGNNGVKMFKNHCKIQLAASESDVPVYIGGKKCKNSLKSELNTAMRVALRNASGNTSAEMRWTKPEQIENWGVRIAGWPTDLPFRNPSNNTVQVNTRLLELLKGGQIKFIKPGDPDWDSAAVTQAKQQQPQQPSKPASPQTVSTPKASPSQQQVVQPSYASHVHPLPGIVLHNGSMDSVELMRNGTAIFHALPPGVGVLNGDALRQGMVTLPVSVAVPVLQPPPQPQGRIEPVASGSRSHDDPPWPSGRSSTSDATSSNYSLKRKRDAGDDHESDRPRTPIAPSATAAVSPLPNRASPT
ncbi:hypothetical protein EXIGLDRAFT_831956 [Exidia glandulosa HHB12029]|uniref:Uncharacterized protein n=1 Tax=Exidia glandulosa HHB12029 TaxID=1314781 RepID=A0A165M3Z8_EXIGL|nr:hypothetical protein EXIGLDRAFT_831956 [Exidia glandulosa HHB12029]